MCQQPASVRGRSDHQRRAVIGSTGFGRAAKSPAMSTMMGTMMGTLMGTLMGTWLSKR